MKIKNHNEPKKHLFNYSKTVKDAFTAFEGGKLPSIKMINEDVKQLLDEKTKLYEAIKKAKVTLRECQIAKGNVALLLGKDNGVKDLQKNKDTHHIR